MEPVDPGPVVWRCWQGRLRIGNGSFQVQLTFICQISSCIFCWNLCSLRKI